MGDHTVPPAAFSIFNNSDIDDSGVARASGGDDWTAHDTSHVQSPSHAFFAPPPPQQQPGWGDTASPDSAGGALRQANGASSAPEGSGGERAKSATGPSSARSRELLGGLLMFRNPLPVATIAVHGQDFFVHAELLCKHSDYFTSCLRGGFAEADAQRIEIDDADISANDFGLWVDLLYRWHFAKPDTFVLRKEETGGTLSTMQILTLWRLSDRFLHKPLTALANESLQHRLGLYSVEQWRKLYRTRPAADIRSRVSRLQEAYRYCCEQELPFTDAIVMACANCPAQVYADCAPMLEIDFMVKVSQRMIMAHADTSLISKDQREQHTLPNGIGGGKRNANAK